MAGTLPSTGEGTLSDRIESAADSKLRKALDHPRRRDILRMLANAGRPLTADEIACDHSESEGQTHYQLDQLLSVGAIVTESSALPPRYYIPVGEKEASFMVLQRAINLAEEEHQGRSLGARLLGVPRPGRTIRLKSRRRK